MSDKKTVTSKEDVVVQTSLFGDDVEINVASTTNNNNVPDSAYKRAAELRRILNYNAYLYYELDKPEITDAQFDRYLVELQELEAKYPSLVTSDSYTQKVGGYVSNKFAPVEHEKKMYSIDDALLGS